MMVVMMIVSFPFIIFTIKSIAFILHTLTHTHNKTSAYYEIVPAPSPLNILNIAVLTTTTTKKTSLVSNFQ